MITLTFACTLDGTFLPMQIIYGGKTSRCLPSGVTFPSSFSLSYNPKHYSNEKEVLKHIDEVILPYVEGERDRLELPEQRALLIMDVFKGQMTDAVLAKLEENNVALIKVPANFTYLFQPLDVQGSVNIAAKQFLKQKFTQWYVMQVIQQINLRNDVDSIDIKFKLTTIKPLHAKWNIELYNYLTSEAGKEVVMKGWVVSGIYDAVQMTSEGLPDLDPFADIDPLHDVQDELELSTSALNRMYIAEYDSDDDVFDDDEQDEQLSQDEDDSDIDKE